MTIYKELYYELFNGICDMIDDQNITGVEEVKNKLIIIQQEAEEYYISAQESYAEIDELVERLKEEGPDSILGGEEAEDEE